MSPEDVAQLRDPARFQDLVQPYRRELAAHCYRMLGSLDDAEDQVQETLLAAWRGIDGFEGRSSLRSWLYKIATHGCIDTIRRRPRRGLPPEHGVPSDPRGPFGEVSPELPWVDPAPASFVEATPPSPEAIFSARESVQLAFIVALQHLPATQRSVLILREVLGWSAAEVAELLDTTVASVNSTLQRARATLDERRARAGEVSADDPELLARYIQAWQTGDVDAIVALLHEDVIVSMPPVPGWIRGRGAMAKLATDKIGPPGALRFVQVAAADRVVFAVYRRPTGKTAFEAHAIQVVRIVAGEVREVHVFLEPRLFAHFGQPAQLHR